MVAVIIPKISSESVSRMVEGISSTLTKNNYKLLLANTFNDAKEEVNYIKALNEYKVDGIILLGTLITEDHLKCLKESKIPIVVLAQKVEDNPCIYYDDFEAARKITETMIKNSKKVAYIGVSNEDVAAGFLRYRGFLQACQNSRGLISCLNCDEIFACPTRKNYVDAVYSSMSKGDGGGFDF